jgi:hypothetical protein
LKRVTMMASAGSLSALAKAGADHGGHREGLGDVVTCDQVAMARMGTGGHQTSAAVAALATTLPSGGGGGQDARGADRVGLCVVSLLAAAHAEIDVRLMDIRQLDLSGSFYDLAAGGFVIHLVGQACAVSAWWRRAARRPSGHRLVGWVSAISATKVSGVRG